MDRTGIIAWIIRFMSTSGMPIVESMRQVIGEMKPVGVRMRHYVVHDKGYADSDEVTPATVVERLRGHEVLHRAGSLICTRKRKVVPPWAALQSLLRKKMTEKPCLRRSFSVYFPQPALKMDLWKAAKDECVGTLGRGRWFKEAKGRKKETEIREIEMINLEGNKFSRWMME